MALKSVVLTVIAILFLTIQSASAATYVVNNLTDTDDGSWIWGPNNVTLRKAIRWANYNGESPDVIKFSVNGTIILNSSLGPLWIGNDNETTINASEHNIIIDASALTNNNTIEIGSNNNTITSGNGLLMIKGALRGIYVAGENNAITGVKINSTIQHGIFLSSNNNTVARCEIENTSVNSVNYSAIWIDGSFNSIKKCNIHDNYGHGIVVRGSHNVIYNCTIYNNGKAHISDFAPSGVIIESGTDNLVTGNTIYQNDGNGIYILGDTNLPANTTVRDNKIFSNGIELTAGVGILIQGTVGGNPSVHILNNSIHNNTAQGILIEPANGNSPTRVRIENNKIYWNGQEGIVIKGPGTNNNTVTQNLIGTDNDTSWPPSVKPNKNSGVAIVNGAKYNVIENNTISYNQYQNVLIKDSGTDYNIIKNNRIFGGTFVFPPPGYNNTGILITNQAKRNTVGPGNKIQYHYFDGILIVGNGTDYNQITGNNEANGGEISHNGRGLSIINDFINVAAGEDLQVEKEVDCSGPAGTNISDNDIKENNNDGILLRYVSPRPDGVTVISNNSIVDNGGNGVDVGNGILCIGSSPDIMNNTITGNHENGIKLEVYFGYDDSPSTYNDDVLCDGPNMTIKNNIFGNNGKVIINNGIGASVYAVDTPLGDISTIYNENTWIADDDVCHIQQDWYGYVKIVDQNGNGVTGETVIVEQGGDASGWGWVYILTTYDSNGNYGPPRFDVNKERTYQKVVEKRVLNNGTIQMFTPQLVYIQGTTYKVEYAYDGRLGPSESGGAIESPQGSGWYRYQYAQITTQSLKVPAESPLSLWILSTLVTIVAFRFRKI